MPCPKKMISHTMAWATFLGALLTVVAADDVSFVADDEAADVIMEEVGGWCGGEDACGVWEAAGPPPDFLSLPPPPVPAFMEEHVQRLHRASGECLLCNWARYNDSLLLVTNDSVTAPWIPILVVVALLSALLGAIAMVVVIKCRRWRVLPSKGLCPLVGMDRSGKDSSAPPPPCSKPPAGRSSSAPLQDRPRGWGGRLWPRSGSQEQGLRSPGQDSENSYAEHPYTCPDQESAVYAELNSVAASQGVPAYRTYMMNTYSEIREPRAHEPRRLLPDGTYENAGYVLEPVGGESGGSGSGHSSAYYSDISAGEPAVVLSSGGAGVRSSQRRRRHHAELPSVSERVPPALRGLGSALVYPRRPLVPVNLLPDAGDLPENLENPPPESTVIAATRKGSHYHGMDNRTIAAAGRLVAHPVDSCANCTLPLGVSVRTGALCATANRRELPLNSSFRSDPDSGQRSGDSGNRSGSDQGSLDGGMRQLPLLPSRRIQGPQKRGVYTLTSQSELPPPSAPPSSEYV